MKLYLIYIYISISCNITDLRPAGKRFLHFEHGDNNAIDGVSVRLSSTIPGTQH